MYTSELVSGADGILLEHGALFSLEAGAAALFRSDTAHTMSLRHALLMLPSLFVVALLSFKINVL